MSFSGARKGGGLHAHPGDAGTREMTPGNNIKIVQPKRTDGGRGKYTGTWKWEKIPRQENSGKKKKKIWRAVGGRRLRTSTAVTERTPAVLPAKKWHFREMTPNELTRDES